MTQNNNDVEEDFDIPFVRRGIFVYPVAFIVVLGFLILALSRSIFVFVLPGEIGVLYDPFFGGTQTLRVYNEGLVAKLPWNRFYTYDTRIQNSRHSIYALSGEGMAINVELSVLFRPRPALTGKLHKELGPQYRERVIGPIVISAVREMISRHPSHELYTTDFNKLQEEIAEELRANPVSDMIDFTSVLISRLDLPPVVLRAIEHKLEQEQIAQAYEFVLQSQRAEAERKRIEAIGIQNFYAIVSPALTEPLLTWRGIEATIEIAKAPNSKVVVVGSGSDQLPIILGGEIGQLPPGPPPAITPVGPGDYPLDVLQSMPRLFPPPGAAMNGTPAITPGADPLAPEAGSSSSFFSPAPSTGNGNEVQPPAADGTGLVPGEDLLPLPTEVEKH